MYERYKHKSEQRYAAKSEEEEEEEEDEEAVKAKQAGAEASDIND